jgi:glutathione synthase/RimK-type ligase-like ATP-grasp enzyme
LHPHDLSLADALSEAGLDPIAEAWTDPSVDWSSYDAVLLCSVDHHTRYDEFTDWLGLLDNAGVPVLNDSDLVRWNGDKRYLLELRERGVAVVPSQVAAGACLREVVAGLDGQEIVIKPTISASTLPTVRGTAGSEGVSRAMDELPDAVYLVQPFQLEFQADGEWSLTFIDGEFSHAVVRRAADDDAVRQDFGGSAEPLAVVLAGATAALAALDTRMPPVYARVDGIVTGGRFLLTELGLIEPNLNLSTSPGATTRLATAVAARLNCRQRRLESHLHPTSPAGKHAAQVTS